jgi:hypothetical protein
MSVLPPRATRESGANGPRLRRIAVMEIHASFCRHGLDVASASSAELAKPALAIIIHFVERVLRLLAREETRQVPFAASEKPTKVRWYGACAPERIFEADL